jgi:hypothetical protein
MATTTTNFGWDIPQSTDLVKDGATAIAALGQDIDTALIDLKGGTTGELLSKASGTDLDFTWVAPASGGGMTLLSTTTLSGTSTTITIAPTGYNNLQIIAKGIYCNTTANLAIRLNSDTGSNYNSMEFSGTAASSITGSAYRAHTYLYQGDYRVASAASDLYNGGVVLNLYRVNDTTSIDHNMIFNGGVSGGSPQYWYGNCVGRYDSSAAITGITFTTMSGTPTFSAGTVYVYGVK